MKIRKGIRILLALVLVLSFTLATAMPAGADDGSEQNGAHFSNSGGKWCAPVTLYGPMGGSFRAHGKVATDGQPAKGFTQAHYNYGALAGSWYRMEIIAMKISEVDGKPAAWYWGEIVAGELVIGGVPQGAYAGYKVGVVVDGGIPGRDVDYFFVSGRIPDASIAEGIYQSEDTGGLPPLYPLLYVDVVQGDIVVK